MQYEFLKSCKIILFLASTSLFLPLYNRQKSQLVQRARLILNPDSSSFPDFSDSLSILFDIYTHDFVSQIYHSLLIGVPRKILEARSTILVLP
ncbi:MAG: hypothetical protein BGO39_13090 [Chloroflexi bacterium 54-19]|nr:MAG: hypothetical protein BGO39_13090 [Chloroflexi bacterium 54-19]